MKERFELYVKICKRAERMGYDGQRHTLLMDLESADKQFNLRLEEMLNAGKEQKLEQVGVTEDAKSWFNPAWIRIKVPNVVVNDYSVLINDLASNHYLKLAGEKLTAGYFNGKKHKR